MTQPIIGGAPAANCNAMKHGARVDHAAQEHRLTLGTLPKSMARVEREARKFRRALEAAVRDANDGRISLVHSLAINAATRAELTAMLATRWLRESADTMTPEQRLAQCKAITDATAARDRAIERLNLDHQAAFDPGDLYRRQPSPVPAEHDDDHDDADPAPAADADDRRDDAEPAPSDATDAKPERQAADCGDGVLTPLEYPRT